MLHACEMNFHYNTSFILLSCILALVVCGSHFELIKNSGQESEGGAFSGTLLHKTFFQCDRQPKCTHVIQLDDSGEYVEVHGEDALEKITNAKIVWKKMLVNVVHGNIALGKPSALSSLYTNDSIAAIAVDGKKAKSSIYCANSNWEENAWLRVDLQAYAIIESITIAGPMYRAMKAVDIRAGDNFQDGGVGNPPCQLNVIIPVNSTTVHVKCPSGTTARYVTVNTRGFIEICELEVYGHYI